MAISSRGVAVLLTAFLSSACASDGPRPSDGIPQREWNRTRASGLKAEDWYGEMQRARVPSPAPAPGVADDDE